MTRVERSGCVGLIPRFLGHEVAGAALMRRYMTMWRRTRDATWAMEAGWGPPDDEILAAGRRDEKITPEQFERRFRALRGYEPDLDWHFSGMIDRIGTTCDVFAPKEDGGPFQPHQLDEDQSLAEVSREFSAYLGSIAEARTPRAIPHP